jgi:3-oxoacyl-[acyl-carrier protein] reductase
VAVTGKLENRTALITGGSRGIGAAIALAFAAEGADVAFCHNDDDDGASEVEAAIRARGRRSFSWRCDIGDMAAARRLFVDAERALGAIDILVNNAGVSEEAPVEAISLEAVDWMLNVHFKATFLLSQLAYISMKARGYGRIINISSNLAYKGALGSRIIAPPRPRCSASRDLLRRKRRRTACWSMRSPPARSIPASTTR